MAKKYRFQLPDISSVDKEARAFVRAFSFAEIQTLIGLSEILDWKAWQSPSVASDFYDDLQGRMVKVDMDIVDAINNITSGGGDVSALVDPLSDIAQELDLIKEMLSDNQTQGNAFLDYLQGLSQALRNEWFDTMGGVVEELFGAVASGISTSLLTGIVNEIENTPESALQAVGVLVQAQGLANATFQLARIANALESDPTSGVVAPSVQNVSYNFYADQSNRSIGKRVDNEQSIEQFNESGETNILDHYHFMQWLGMTAGEVAKFSVKIVDTLDTANASGAYEYVLDIIATIVDVVSGNPVDVVLDQSQWTADMLFFPTLGVSAALQETALEPMVAYVSSLPYEAVYEALEQYVIDNTPIWQLPPMGDLIDLRARIKPVTIAYVTEPKRGVVSRVTREWKDHEVLQRPPVVKTKR